MGLKPSAMEYKARLRGLWRIIYSKTIRPGLLTSQLYFDDAVSDAVFAQAPYAARGNRTTRNQNDGIFRRNGEQLVLALTPTDQGYAATFEIGLQL